MSDQATAIIKLPVWRTAKAAYLVIFHNPGLAVKLAAVPIILLIIQNAVMTYIWGGMTQAQVTASMKENVGLLILVSVAGWVFYLATIPMITAWHRMVILGHADPDSRIRYSIKRPEWLYLWAAFLFGLLVMLVYFLGSLMLVIPNAMVAVVAPHTNAGLMILVMTVLGVLLLSFVVALILRVSLVFPSAAIGEPIWFGESWRKSKGNTWRLFWAVCLGFIPSFIVPIVLSGVLFGVWIFNVDDMVMPGVWAQIAMSLINIPFWLIGLCVGVSVWSWAYRYLYQELPITLPGET